MRRTRFVSLLLFVFSLAFLGVREFRLAVLAPLAGSVDIGPEPWRSPISTEKLQRFAAEAEAAGDARSLAFVALHLPLESVAETQKLADRAVELDASLTWIYLHLSMHTFTEWKRTEVVAEIHSWATRLVAWDPQNAAPYLLRAELIRRRRMGSWPQGRGTQTFFLDGLESQTDWRAEMEAAFTKPRYDFYSVRRFDLERHVLRQQGWDTPATLLLSARAWPTPDQINIRDYANLLEHKYGTRAEAAGRVQEALGYYWKVAHFGERLRLEGHTLSEWETGNELRRGSYERIIPLLQKTGKLAETATVEFALAQLNQEREVLAGGVPLARSTNHNWSALTMNVFSALVLLFLVASLACVLYVLPRGGYASSRRDRLWQLMLTGQNYMPLLLFVACVGLYVTYYPYAQNFTYYLTAKGAVTSFEPLFYNTLPGYSLATARTQLEIQNPLRSYAAWALLGLVLLAAVTFGVRWREERAESARKAAR